MVRKNQTHLNDPWIKNELAGAVDDPVLIDYVNRREEMYLRAAEKGEFKSGYLNSLDDPRSTAEELEIYEAIIEKRKQQRARRLPDHE